jgi:hypothetical protein
MKKCGFVLLADYFLWSVSAILIVTGVVKLATVLRPNLSLGQNDSILFFLTKGQALFVAGLFEIAVAAFILWHPHHIQRLYVTNAFAVLLLSYRLSVVMISGARVSCDCLGDIYKWLGVNREHIDQAALVILAYISLTSSMLLLLFRNRAQNLTGLHSMTDSLQPM